MKTLQVMEGYKPEAILVSVVPTFHLPSSSPAFSPIPSCLPQPLLTQDMGTISQVSLVLGLGDSSGQTQSGPSLEFSDHWETRDNKVVIYTAGV